jgi:hypothetical protein
MSNRADATRSSWLATLEKFKYDPDRPESHVTLLRLSPRWMPREIIRFCLLEYIRLLCGYRSH